MKVIIRDKTGSDPLYSGAEIEFNDLEAALHVIGEMLVTSKGIESITIIPESEG